MREMVLNHASLEAPTQDIAADWLKNLILGLSQLVGAGVASATLRARYFPHEVLCLPERTLFDISLYLLQKGAHEEFRFFNTLNSKVPLLNDPDPQAKARFLGCQHKTMSDQDGEPLLYCAIAGSVAVGFPSSQEWDLDLLTVAFDELMPNGTSEEWSEDIDNVARKQHAETIVERHRHEVREQILNSGNGNAIWNSKETAFPHLFFGRDVESHLSEINHGELGTLIRRLASLDEASAAWPLERAEAPPWNSKVTDENQSVKTNPRLREARRFRSNQGNQELFYWHARFGSHRRIHLRFDRTTFAVEIGYIGNHLPLRDD